MDKPVVIEVALNGATTTERNPNVPQTQQALVEDAIRCIEAGASVVHTHAPDISLAGKDGSQQYLEHFLPISERFSEAILYPTLVFGDDIETKTSHIEPLAQAYPLKMGFVDPGSLLSEPCPESLDRHWRRADASTFRPPETLAH